MQLARFLAVGALNTAAGLACIAGAMRWLAPDYRLANAAGCGLGFSPNPVWTFGDRAPWQGSLERRLGVAGACWRLNLLATALLHEASSLDAYAAQVGGACTHTGAMFLGSRHIAFRPGRVAVRAGA